MCEASPEELHGKWSPLIPASSFYVLVVTLLYCIYLQLKLIYDIW